jgi:hypothetical protein
VTGTPAAVWAAAGVTAVRSSRISVRSLRATSFRQRV